MSHAAAEVSHAAAEVPHRGVTKVSSRVSVRPLKRCHGAVSEVSFSELKKHASSSLKDDEIAEL